MLSKRIDLQDFRYPILLSRPRWEVVWGVFFSQPAFGLVLCRISTTVSALPSHGRDEGPIPLFDSRKQTADLARTLHIWVFIRFPVTCRVRLSVRTRDFHSLKRSSTLLPGTIVLSNSWLVRGSLTPETVGSNPPWTTMEMVGSNPPPGAAYAVRLARGSWPEMGLRRQRLERHQQCRCSSGGQSG